MNLPFPGGDFSRRWQRVRSVATNELRLILRDWVLIGFLAIVPVIQLTLFGYAINQDIRQVPTAVVNRSASAVSRRLVGELAATQTLRITATAATEEEGRRLLEAGRVQAVVVVPEDFSRTWYRGRGAEISVLVDASDPLRARAVRAAVEGLGESWEEERLAQTAGGRERAAPELIHARGLSFTVLTYYNPELRTPVFVVPGLLGVILTQTMVLLTSLALVREREKGTFEFLISTPVRRSELMVGKILPYIAIGFGQATVVIAVGWLLFRVPVEGSLAALAVATLVFIAANLTLGLSISAACRSQIQATNLAFFFFLPSVLLSGFMFPFEAMPKPAQWIGEFLPLTHYIRVCRAILLRGAPLSDSAGSLAALLAFTVVGLVAATRLFKKRLD